MSLFALSTRLLAADPEPSASGLAGTASSPADTKQIRIPFDASRWRLVWSEEFDRPGAPDPATWSYESGYLRNKEAQFYTADRPQNVRVENGRLILEAHLHPEPGAEHRITSGSITTRGKREFLYGRIAVRAKVPTGRGTWPAIWTLGLPPNGPAKWPAQGEIDIMEYVGFDPARIHANIHTSAYNHVKRTGKGAAIKLAEPWTRFHEFAVEWHEDRLEFFVDDTRYFVFRRESADPAVWPFAHPHYLKLNLAIGGTWGGAKGIDESLFPHRFEVDYVRYYQLRTP
jgi:beta-glucanase (GH16 family)